MAVTITAKQWAFPAAIILIGLNFHGCTDTPEKETDKEQIPIVAVPEYPIDICGGQAPTYTAETGGQQSTACSEAPVEIMASHSPLYKPQPHTSTITATASNPTGALTQIDIYVTTGKVSDCTESGSSPELIPCRKNAVVQEPHKCPVTPLENPAQCEVTIEITDGDLITYFAVASVAPGSELATSAITYSGGTPTVKVAMPVWWHTNVPNASLNTGRLQVAFFPDSDFVTAIDEYADMLSSIVMQSHFAKTKPFGRAYTYYRHFFDIWAFPYAGASPDFDTCDHKFVDATAILMDGLVDGSAILHRSTETDCSSITTDGVGTVRTDLSDLAWLFVHESGHFLFGLADEYGQGGQVPESDPPNVFATQSDCDLIKPAYGPTAECNDFGWYTETYRIETTEPETMKKRLLTSDFWNTSDTAIKNRITECLGGSC